jgi:cytoskeletal protein CcmA (bactofilin family)
MFQIILVLSAGVLGKTVERRGVHGGDMSAKHNGGAGSQSGVAGKTGTDASKASEHPVGEAMERLQSVYASESDSAKAERKPGNLVAYAGVRVKGEIDSCDTLTVEGDIDAMVRARQIIVAECGAFAGRADVDDAEIAGRFDGTLRVSGKLVIRRTGKLSGNIIYGQIEIEAGGEIRGRVDVRSNAKKNGFLSASEKRWSWKS